MGYRGSQERNRRLKKLCDETKYSSRGAGAFYDEDKGRYVKYSPRRKPGHAKFLRRVANRNVYNKLVEYGLKAYNEILAAQSKAEAEKYEKEARAKRNAEKAKRKKERKAAAKREAEIEIQKEAYLRAMRELHTVAAK